MAIVTAAGKRKERTFELEESFPPYPLPHLDSTLRKYLESGMGFLFLVYFIYTPPYFHLY